MTNPANSLAALHVVTDQLQSLTRADTKTLGVLGRQDHGDGDFPEHLHTLF